MADMDQKRIVKLRRKIKAWLSNYPVVYKIVIRVYRVFFREPTIQERILSVLNRKPSIFFLQIGSNDGLQGDPLHELIVRDHKWKGIFIEPVGFIFRRLLKNYNHDSRFIYENVAIDNQAGTRTFYYLSPQAKQDLGDELPYWHDQLGSFTREHISRALGSKLEPYIVEEEIKCVPLQEVLDRNKVADIDLIHIDTEGHDYKILLQVDFSRYHPSVILFEHQLLSPEELKQGRAKLIGAGYELYEYGADTLALRRS